MGKPEARNPTRCDGATARRSRNHKEKNRIMAGQNHKAPIIMVLLTTEQWFSLSPV